MGIDLGTTNSCVAVLKDGADKPVVVANSEGQRTTPSVVAFTEAGDRLVGSLAKRQAATNHANTFFGTKRLIGRRFQEIVDEAQSLPFAVVRGKNGDAYLSTTSRNAPASPAPAGPAPKESLMSPSEIGALVLQKMKETAEGFAGRPLSEAVITVPAYFDDAQRQATKDAGEIAGLKVLRILNEPTAAALAYGVDRSASDGQRVAVFDLGGGTFDVSILELHDGVYQVKATNGDARLGGEDFDAAFSDHLLQKLKQESGVDFSSDKLALQRVREAAETAKQELSMREETIINVPFLGFKMPDEKEGSGSGSSPVPISLQARVTRKEFEMVCERLFQRTVEPCKKAMRDAGIKKAEVDAVLLVGGMTRCPKIKELVEHVFGRKPLDTELVNPDEAVAVGAAIQAGIISGQVKDLLLLDVIPLSLGIETMGGVFSRIVNRNSTIPTRRAEIFSTAADNQERVGIKIYQGERELVANNKLLAEFDLVGIPPAPRGIPQIEVAFDIDANGILNVSAVDKLTGKKQEIKVQSDSGLSKDEIANIIADAEKARVADTRAKELLELQEQANTLIDRCKQQISDFAADLTKAESTQFGAMITDLQQAMLLTPDAAEAGTEREAQIRTAIKNLQKLSWDLSKKYYAPK